MWCWRRMRIIEAGVPFVDSIEIEMGRPARDRLLDLEVGKADFAEIPPEEARRAAERGVRVSTRSQMSWWRWSLWPGHPVEEDAHGARGAVAFDRSRRDREFHLAERRRAGRRTCCRSGRAARRFCFRPRPIAAGAKELWAQIGRRRRLCWDMIPAIRWNKSIAERIAVNARDAGIRAHGGCDCRAGRRHIARKLRRAVGAC